MPFVTYVAKRALAPSHIADQSYSIDISITALQRPSGGDLKVVQKSMSGNVETQFYGEERIWAVTLAPIRISDADNLYEFLRSTSDGQTFSFDPYGTGGSNVLLLDVVREDSGYTESVFQSEGRGGRTDWVTLGFSVREA